MFNFCIPYCTPTQIQIDSTCTNRTCPVVTNSNVNGPLNNIFINPNVILTVLYIKCI